MPEINLSIKIIGGKRTAHKVLVNYVGGKKIKFTDSDELTSDKAAEFVKTQLVEFIESRILN